MMKGLLRKSLALTLLTVNASYACIHGKFQDGFAPKNNLKISRFAKDGNGMTEQTFLSIVKKVSDVYAPIVSKHGGTLKMVNDWNDGTVNAYANRSGSTWEVHMFGGLARHQLTTNDGFALVVCHELGHHLGGAPRYSRMTDDWAATEGQSDYWGSMKCMRRVFMNDNNEDIVAKMKVDAEVTKKCQAVYHNANEIALCQRIGMAGKSLGSLLASLGGDGKVDFTTPDTSVVRKTFEAHPKGQCRLDTYFQATLCDISYDIDTDVKDPKVGVCLKRDGHPFGMRPLCWYKPSLGE